VPAVRLVTQGALDEPFARARDRVLSCPGSGWVDRSSASRVRRFAPGTRREVQKFRMLATRKPNRALGVVATTVIVGRGRHRREDARLQDVGILIIVDQNS